MALILSGTDNSVSSPAVQGGTGGTSTGVYYPASNQLALATNGTQALLVDSSQNVGIGTSSPAFPLNVASSTTLAGGTPSIVLQGSTNTERIQVRSSVSTGGQAVIGLLSSRGSIASPTVTLNGDPLGYYQLGGYNGTSYNRGAWMYGLADGDWSATNQGSIIGFSTTPNGSTTITERMRITSAGGISFGSSGTNYGTSGQVLTSAGNAAPTWTTATNANTASAIVQRDASGNFSAGTITATLSGNATNVSGTVAVGNGGSGQTTAQAAMNTFAGAVTSGSYLRGNGTNVVMSTIQAGDVPTLNQNTTGSAATVTGNATGSTFGFNSGYGSVATAYGCRVWVNFNGTGTVAIRASGNVSSITDNGTGDYTVNFTNAMPDANYAVFGNSGVGNASFVCNRFNQTAPTTTAARIGVFDDTGAAKDDPRISFEVIR